MIEGTSLELPTSENDQLINIEADQHPLPQGEEIQKPIMTAEDWVDSPLNQGRFSPKFPRENLKRLLARSSLPPAEQIKALALIYGAGNQPIVGTASVHPEIESADPGTIDLERVAIPDRTSREFQKYVQAIHQGQFGTRAEAVLGKIGYLVENRQVSEALTGFKYFLEADEVSLYPANEILSQRKDAGHNSTFVNARNGRGFLLIKSDFDRLDDFGQLMYLAHKYKSICLQRQNLRDSQHLKAIFQSDIALLDLAANVGVGNKSFIDGAKAEYTRRIKRSSQLGILNQIRSLFGRK